MSRLFFQKAEFTFDSLCRRARLSSLLQSVFTNVASRILQCRSLRALAFDRYRLGGGKIYFGLRASSLAHVILAMMVLFGAIASVSGAAYAESRTYQTTSNKPVMIARHSSSGANCQQGAIPWITITKKPENGHLDTTVDSYKLKGILFGNTKCIGTSVKGVQLYYAPNKLFKGTDRVEYFVTFGAVRRFDYSVQINVK